MAKPYITTPARSARSAEAYNDAAETLRLNAPRWIVAAFGISIGFIFWTVGARYTLDGLIIGLNVLFNWLGLPVQLPAAASWWVLLLFPIGAIFSIIEFYFRPAKPEPGLAWVALALVWCIAIGIDMGSTQLGIINPAPDAWSVNRWLAATPWAATIWNIILTFVPEVLMLGSIIYAIGKENERAESDV